MQNKDLEQRKSTTDWEKLTNAHHVTRNLTRETMSDTCLGFFTVSAAKICTRQVLPIEKKESTYGNRQFELICGICLYILRTNNVDYNFPTLQSSVW